MAQVGSFYQFATVLCGVLSIETINDQLKNISQIEHSRHRSVTNFLINLMVGLIAYTHQEKKPSLNINHEHLALLTTAM